MATYRAAPAREAYGGFNWGAGFFGWLVAIAVGALLTALFAAAGAAVALGEIDVNGIEGDELGIGGAIGLFVIALISYFAGGYVAGRMSRFDGARQGVAVWLWAVVIAIVLALLGWIADREWNVLAELNLPRIPADETLTALGIATLIVILGGTLLAAIGGGILGVRYHTKVTDAALAGPPARDERAARRDQEAARRDEDAARRDEDPTAREGRPAGDEQPPADRSAEAEGRRPPPPRE